MKPIKDSSYIKMLKSKKYKDLFDLSSLECRIAIVGMVIIDFIFVFCSICVGLNEIIEFGVSVAYDIGIALIGFLGFTVSALAILTGAISSKVVKMLQDRNKIAILERILLSFYLMGLVCAFEILVIFISSFLVKLPIDSILISNVLLVSIVSYCTIFVIFYAVKLIGNCLELFYIVNNLELIGNKSIDFKSKYNSYRIAVLERELFRDSSIEKIQGYKDDIEELIKCDDIPDEEKRLLFNMLNEHFGS